MESPMIWASTRSNADGPSLLAIPARFGSTSDWPGPDAGSVVGAPVIFGRGSAEDRARGSDRPVGSTGAGAGAGSGARPGVGWPTVGRPAILLGSGAAPGLLTAGGGTGAVPAGVPGVRLLRPVAGFAPWAGRVPCG
jgi:hypothetical protein